MRQAYDYWQDQPGNYFPTAEVESTCCKHPLLTSNVKAGSFLGWAFVTRLRMPSHTKCSFPLQLQLAFHNKVYKHHATGNGNTLSPGLTGFGHRSPCPRRQGSPPSERTTIDRQHLQGTRQPRWIPKWLIDEAGLAHRQLIHILQHCRRECQ